MTVAIRTGDVFRVHSLQFPLASACENSTRRNVMRIVALSARRVDSFGREHNPGRCAGAAGSPGFIIDVDVAVAVAGDAPDVLSGVGHSDYLLCEIQMTDVAPAVVSASVLTFREFRFFFEEQEGFFLLSKQERRCEKASEDE